MANRKLYWLGTKVGRRRVGRLKVDGKLLAIGESFQASKMDADRLSQLKKVGSVGESTISQSEKDANDIKDKDLVMLRGRVVDLESKMSEAGKAINELTNQNLDLAGDVERLTDENSDLKTVVEESANLSGELVDDLTADIKKLTTENTDLQKQLKKGKK